MVMPGHTKLLYTIFLPVLPHDEIKSSKENEVKEISNEVLISKNDFF